jgi:hypothetical protein
MRRVGYLLVFALFAASCGGESDDSTKPARTAHKLELRDNRHGGVYMGVRCRTPNSVRCDRVGLAVWLARPAECLVAWIEGRRIQLALDRPWSRPEETPWIGNLKPAGLRHAGGPLETAPEPGEPDDYWSGRAPVEAKIRLRALYPDGTSATRTIHAPLHPGWG